MIRDSSDHGRAAAALAEIETRRTQAVTLARRRPGWMLLALMGFVVMEFAWRDLPAGNVSSTISILVNVGFMIVVLLGLRSRRATLHSSLRWRGWWIPAVGLALLVPLVIWLPGYLAGLGLRYPHVVTGLVLAGISGCFVAAIERLGRTYALRRRAH